MTDQARGELVPGGLAMTYGLNEHPEANGNFVCLLYFGEHVVKGSDAPVFGWYCEGGWMKAYTKKGKGVIGAKNLMPINPEADPLSIDQRQECEA